MHAPAPLSPAPACVALLRGVNVGGRKTLAMADVRGAAEAIGAAGPRTVLQSGNLIFRSAAAPAELEARLAKQLAATCGLATTIIVRTAPDWTALVAALPFAELAADLSHVVAMVLRDAPDEAGRAALQAAFHGREQAVVLGATAYIAYPDGIGRSQLTLARIEKALGTVATGRNWRTVTRIAEALSEVIADVRA